MIHTDITGGNSDASQVFNLLAVVANPDVYAEKMRTLMDATAEHNRLLALIGPASEILAIREQVDKDKKAFDESCAKEKEKIAQLKSSAQAASKEKISTATQKADGIVAAAEQVKAEAERVMAEAVQALANADAAAKAAAKAQDKAEAAGAAAKAAQNSADQLLAEVEARRQALIALHTKQIDELKK
jgi:hypothetical protein